MPESLGFIGLGIMGQAMALRLREAGYPLTLYNRSEEKCAPLVAAGARLARSPREAAQGNSVVLSIVTDGAAVEEVLLGPQGAREGAEKGAIFIDLSTIAPSAARRVGAALREKGVGFLDAPVTGMEVRAREGTLSILVGGEKADLDRVRNVLSILGSKITYFGPQGSGQVAKACNQILCAVNMVGLVESLQLARLSGLDQKTLLEALIPGAGGSWALERFGPQIARGDFQPGGRIALMLKDLRIILGEAEAMGLPVPGARVAQKWFLDSEAHGERDLGTQAMYKALGRAIGRGS
jgi:3-hydroxyisobutyrate dehydrogenase